jgi:hypothetical protein
VLLKQHSPSRSIAGTPPPKFVDSPHARQATKPRKNPYSRAIDAYYQTLKDFTHQRAFHEGAVSTAFQSLLSESAKLHHWTLIPQLSKKDSGTGIRPDGTLKDFMSLVRGHL